MANNQFCMVKQYTRDSSRSRCSWVVSVAVSSAFWRLDVPIAFSASLSNSAAVALYCILSAPLRGLKDGR